ncbi:hypothetical protein DL764_006164 [Monosporascus ibericus]|uniref:Nephrocystin 3-like N-terminal domain-containing protein n=1 Tax=Monosporascus ibericus TaxID=155417 RepID=A0A4V1XA64_9PEZI|nr:hypothetical protein DL764_006164 [Monosporascus ibericus]
MEEVRFVMGSDATAERVLEQVKIVRSRTILLLALGIAAAVVQFADFGYCVVKDTYDAYESSSSRAANDIELTTVSHGLSHDLSHDLSQVLENAEAKLENGWPGQEAPSSPTNDAGSPVDIFRRLCRECREIKSALDEIFAKLVPRGKSRVALAASSFVVELKRISRAGEIDRLAERLSQVQQQTMIAILVLLLGEAKDGANTRQFAQQQADIMAKVAQIDEAAPNFRVHKLQKSREGLLRTPLFGILQQDNSIVSRIFPGRWFLLQIFGGKVDLPQPQFGELLAAFRALLSETAETLRLALIIDGLDEFEDDHRTLVGLLREANRKPWVKICTSSRPWNVFKDEYIDNPMLQLEKLTHEDIELYVTKDFSGARVSKNSR